MLCRYDKVTDSNLQDRYLHDVVEQAARLVHEALIPAAGAELVDGAEAGGGGVFVGRVEVEGGVLRMGFAGMAGVEVGVHLNVRISLAIEVREVEHWIVEIVFVVGCPVSVDADIWSLRYEGLLVFG